MVKDFENKRTELYSYFTLVENITEILPSKKQGFFNLLELCTLSMMEGEENFFGKFMLNINREIRLDISEGVTTKATLEGLYMYFNPIIFLAYNEGEMKALIKHEIYHLMYGHNIRQRDLKNKFSELAINIAMDIAINQYIKNLPKSALTIEGVNRSYNLSLSYDKTLEYYVPIIEKALEGKRKKKEKIIVARENSTIQREIDIETMHRLWKENLETVDKDFLRNVTKKVANKAKDKKMSKELEEILQSLNKKSEIEWIKYVKKSIATMPFGYKKTIMRRDRRQPYRNDLKGVLRDRISKVIVAIDISASMTEEEIRDILKEIFYISRNYPLDITVIECDSEIKRVYKIKSIQDIKQGLKRNGDTAFSPVFKYIEKNKLKDSLLIYFTDGKGEKSLEVKPCNYKTLWVLTNKKEELSLDNPNGYILYLNNKLDKNIDMGDALEMYRESSDIHNRVHM